MPKTDRLECDTDWIDLEFLEREATPQSAMELGIHLHVAGLSLSNTAAVLADLGVDRHRTTVHTWVQKADLQHHPQSGHAALDSTFFDRSSASSYYRHRSGSNVQTLKVTTLTDRESLAVLDLYISARWKHDTKTGPQVVRRNADDLLSVAADKAFHNWLTNYECYALGVDPLILQRGSRPLTQGHNALIRAKEYSQRWMAETSYSTTKRSLG